MEKIIKEDTLREKRIFFCDLCEKEIVDGDAQTRIISYECGDEWEPYTEVYVVHLCTDCLEKTILKDIIKRKLPIYREGWREDKKIVNTKDYFSYIGE